MPMALHCTMETVADGSGSYFVVLIAAFVLVPLPRLPLRRA